MDATSVVCNWKVKCGAVVFGSRYNYPRCSSEPPQRTMWCMVRCQVTGVLHCLLHSNHGMLSTLGATSVAALLRVAMELYYIPHTLRPIILSRSSRQRPRMAIICFCNSTCMCSWCRALSSLATPCRKRTVPLHIAQPNSTILHMFSIKDGICCAMTQASLNRRHLTIELFSSLLLAEG